MPKFLVRVELKEVPDSQSRDVYERLHDEMDKADFTREIKGSVARWQLPRATYLGDFELTSADVRDRAADAARKAWKKAQIIVVQYAGAAWTGLDKAD